MIAYKIQILSNIKNDQNYTLRYEKYRAGHLRYFLIFSLMKNDIFCILYQDNLTGGRHF